MSTDELAEEFVADPDAIEALRQLAGQLELDVPVPDTPAPEPITVGEVFDSIEFLKKALELARTFVQAERLEAAGELDSASGALLDPHIGALTVPVAGVEPGRAGIAFT